MTSALKNLLKAHSEDHEFPYMDFIGAFLLVERWIARTDGHSLLQRFNEATADDLLGLPLGDSVHDLKLGYVLGLLRNHAEEVYHELRAQEPRLSN